MRRIAPENTIVISEFPQLRGEIVIEQALKSWEVRSQDQKSAVQIVAVDEKQVEQPEVLQLPEPKPESPLELQPKLEPQPQSQPEIPVQVSAQIVTPSLKIPRPKESTPEQYTDVVPLQKPSPVKSKKRYRFLRTTGNVLIGASLFGILFFGAPMIALELRSFVHKTTQPFFPEAVPTELSQLPMQENVITPVANQLFRIRIPMIGVESDIIPNVDAGDSKAYETALQKGIAHAKGSGLPGEENAENRTIYIFAHSTNGSWNITRYNALFYSLKDLEPGDQIQVWFWGKEYWYKVSEKRVVDADDTEVLKPQKEKELLVLQTCWPPGTTWKRLLILAEPVQKQ